MRAASLGRPEHAGCVADVELQEVVWQLVIEDRVLRVQPLAVDGEAAIHASGKRGGVRARPPLEQIPVLLSRAADEDMPATLQPESRLGIERDTGVRTIELLLDDAEPAAQHVERDLIEIGVARLEPRALEVTRARIFMDLAHRVDTATMWLST